VHAAARVRVFDIGGGSTEVVHGIVGQSGLAFARRKPAADELPETLYEPGPSPFEQAVGSETLVRFEAALARLHDEEREAVVLRVELRYSYAEIAAAMGKPSADAARMTVGRALVRLAQEMGHVQ
jgi:RNA polymerase sigma-70 factor (ECF subfamily)